MKYVWQSMVRAFKEIRLVLSGENLSNYFLAPENKQLLNTNFWAYVEFRIKLFTHLLEMPEFTLINGKHASHN